MRGLEWIFFNGAWAGPFHIMPMEANFPVHSHVVSGLFWMPECLLSLPRTFLIHSLWFIIRSRIAGQSTSASSPEERGESDCGKPWSSPKTWNGYAWNLPQLDWGWAVRFLCQYWLRDTDLVEALCSEGFWGSKQMNGAGGEHLLDHTGEGKGPLSALF